MKVAGFTFIRNAVLYDYPVTEAIRSVLPLCDHFVVAVGKSDDNTLQLVQSIGDPRIQIMETQWDDSLREGGRVLAVETDKAFQAIGADFDWCFYIQADECVHEDDIPAIRSGMQQWLHDPKTEGLLFHYKHFYGSYDYTGASRRWYRREVRIVRNNKNIYSYRDAQGFRIRDTPHSSGRKLRVRLIPATIYHYGWVKHPEAQLRKQQNFNRLWHSDEKVKVLVGERNTYNYDGSEPLSKYTGSHPVVMHPRIKAINWQFANDPTRIRNSWKNRLSNWIEKLSGYRPFEYRNYRLLRF
jgi:hypothetical protein